MKRMPTAALIVLTIAANLPACSVAPRPLQLDSTAKEPAMTRPAAETQTTPEGCTIEKFTIASKSMHRDIKVAIVLPPAYAADSKARFPVLYTLHGADAPYATFAEMSPLRETLRDHPMIVTCFDGDKRGWYIDATKKEDSLFLTFFFDEFIPYVDAHYRTKADNHSRALTGFSMGGFGAFNYMLTHPDMFASVSSLSGVFDILGDHGAKNPNYLAPLLGPMGANKADYLKYGIYNRLDDYIAKGTPLPPMYLHCGTEDSLLEQNRFFLTFLIEHNQKLIAQKKPALTLQYKESPGAHKWPFWRDASEAVADFHWRSFQQSGRAK